MTKTSGAAGEAGQATLGEEIAALDREAREALDRLAKAREELERRHRATDLAAGRQRAGGDDTLFGCLNFLLFSPVSVVVVMFAIATRRRAPWDGSPG